MRRAPADVARHGRHDVLVARIRIAGQERRRGHELAGLAVPALRHLLGDPGDLQRMPAGRVQALDGRDLLARGLRHRRLARTHGPAVEMHRARAALRDAAAELRAGQLRRGSTQRVRTTSQAPARNGTATRPPTRPPSWKPASSATRTASACRPVARPTKYGASSLPSIVWHRTITGSVIPARTTPSLSADSVARTVAIVAPTKGATLRTAATAPMSSAYLTPRSASATAMSTPTKKLDTIWPRT